jgi:hypothetical protein
MVILNKVSVIAGFVLIACTPLAHNWLHTIYDNTATEAYNVRSSKIGDFGRTTLDKSPEMTLRAPVSQAGLTSIDQESHAQPSGVAASTDSVSVKEKEYLEVGPQLNADAPAEWAIHEYGEEINIGKTLSASATVHMQPEKLGKAINVDEELPWQDRGVIEIGPEIEVDF